MFYKTNSKMILRVLFMAFIAVVVAFLGVFAGSEVFAEEPTVVNSGDELIQAINDGVSQVKLGNNISYNENTISKDIIIDLNGKTMSIQSIDICNKLTIKDSSQDKDGKITSDSSVSFVNVKEKGEMILESGIISGSNQYGILTVDSGGKATISGGAVKNLNSNWILEGVIHEDSPCIDTYGELFVSGGNIEAQNDYALIVRAGGKAIISGGSFKADSVCIECYGELYISDGTFVANKSTAVEINQLSAKATIKGGVFKASNHCLSVIYPKVEISGGSFESTQGNALYNQGNTIISGGCFKGKTHTISNYNDLFISGGIIEAEEDIAMYCIHGETVTINGGTIKAKNQTIYNDGSKKLEISGGVIIATENHAIDMKNNTLNMSGGKVEALGSGAAIELNGSTADIEGGSIKAIYTDSEQNPGGTGIVVNNTKLTVSGGSIESSLNAINTANSEITIDDGNITGGSSGIEIRSGKLSVSGGTITGNTEEYDASGVGCAVAVVQQDNMKSIDIDISGGEFYGRLPLREDNYYENSQESLKEIKYNISGGVFHSTGDKTIYINDYVNGPFISAGFFKHSVTAVKSDDPDEPDVSYVKDGYKEHISRIEPVGYYNISKWYDVKLTSPENGKAMLIHYNTISADENEIKDEKTWESSNQGTALTTDLIKVDTVPDEGFEIDKITYTDNNGTETDITADGFFYMPNSDVTVKVFFKKAPPAPTPTPTPEVKPTPEATPTSAPTTAPTKLEDIEKKIKDMKSEADLDNTFYLPLKLKAGRITKNSISYSWKKVKGATKYAIYANKCNKKNRCTKIAEVADTKFTLSMIDGKKLKKGTYYKLVLVAADNDNNVIATSKVVHAATKGGKVTNYKSISIKKDKKIKKGKLALKKGKTFKLKVKTKKVDKKKKLSVHRKICFESDNTAVATVSKSGKIKAVAPGTCKIYAYTQNGLYKTLTVTVK